MVKIEANLMKTLIFAVDDEAPIRELYAALLRSAGFDYACFSSAEELFLALVSTKPALILLDIMLEKMDGYAILEKLKGNKDTKDIPVIMVSAKGEEISKVKGLDLGASDYIAKPFGVLELVARIKANIRKTVDYSTHEYADILIDDGKHEVYVNGEKITLTLKGYELLKLLVSRAPNVVSREAMMREVWGEDYLGETRTIDIHVSTLRKALSGSASSIKMVRGVGYFLQ